jgi:HPt (histidine-containing phosphotransfer) domain-containing protein
MTDSSSSTDAVDVSSLLFLRQMQRPGAQDAVGRIVDRFLEETPERVATLRTAIDGDDARLLEQAAHAMKGIAGTVGANEMRDVAELLENLGRAGSTAGARRLVDDLESALTRARPIFEGLKGAA